MQFLVCLLRSPVNRRNRAISLIELWWAARPRSVSVIDSMTMSAPWTRVNLAVLANQKAREKGAER